MSESKSSEGEWRSAQDQKSGRTYYYNTKTKATTWNKPLELATPEERETMIREKQETAQFFKEMEDNIKRKIDQAIRDDEASKFYEHSRMSRDAYDDEGYYMVDDANLGSLSNEHNRVSPSSAGSGGGYNSSKLNSSQQGRRTRSRSIRFSQTISEAGLDPESSFGPGDLLRDQSSGDPGGILYEASEGRSRAGTGIGSSMLAVRRVRTISTMDDEILMTMQKAPARHRDSLSRDMSTAFSGSNGISTSTTAAAAALRQNSDDSAADSKSPDYGRASRRMSEKYDSSPISFRSGAKEVLDKVADRFPNVPSKLESKDVADLLERAAPSKSSAGQNKQTAEKAEQLKRRNSTGTLFVDATMSQQDNNATIECVCVVIRAHMIDAARLNVEPLPKYDIFKDTSLKTGNEDEKGVDEMEKVPSLNTVKDFFQYVFSKSQLESDCIIMALIYCERLVKETKGRLCIRYDNWRAILFACLVMASKVWDDLSMWNVDFSQVYPSFDLIRINSLELALLEALKYSIRVPASEYAKYYFHLRSLMARLGLEGPEHGASMRPLDVTGAKKLQLSTEKYLEEATEVNTSRRRVRSMHTSFSEVDLSSPSLERGTSHEPYQGLGSGKHSAVGLEQLIHDAHLDADGQVHVNKKSPSYKAQQALSSSYKNLRTNHK